MTSRFSFVWLNLVSSLRGSICLELWIGALHLKDKSVLGRSGLINYMSFGVLRKERYLSPKLFLFPETDFQKPFFKIFCIYLLLEKLINKKNFQSIKKFGLVFRKVFSFYFR